MRVLKVIAQKPGYTGSGIYLRALLSKAPQYGITQASVVGLNSYDEPDLENIHPIRFESEKLPFPVVGMSDVMPYRSSRWPDLTEQQLAQYRRTFEETISEAVERFQPDLIHCHHLWLCTALTRELVRDLPVVASCHGTGLRQGVKLPHLWERWQPSLAELDHVFCLTPQQEERCRALNCPTSVVGAGFEESIFHSQGRKKEGPFRMLYAGKLARAKGVLELLNAAAPTLEKGTSLALAGSGMGEEAETIARQAEHCGATLLGRLDQMTLSQEMRNSDLFVLPSYYEGLPLVLAEALSCGCRVVVSDLPGIREWLPDELLQSGWVTLVKLPRLEGADQPFPQDVPEFVDRLRRALETQSQKILTPPPQLSAFLRECSWSGVFSKIHQTYRELLK